MATESVATPKPAPDDHCGEGLESFNNVIDRKAADAIFKAMSVLAMGIEATMGRSVDRAFTQWPNTAEAVWDMLDGILIRAGFSDGKDRPWVSALEDDQPEPTAEAQA